MPTAREELLARGVDRLEWQGATEAHASLRQDLLAALGEEMTHEKRLEEEPSLERELSWRRGWNAKRESMLEAINRLLPEEG